MNTSSFVFLSALSALLVATACGRMNRAEAAKGDSVIIPITSAAAFAEQVEQAQTPVLVTFSAVWCGPCRAMEPVLEATPTRFNDGVRVAKVDIDQVRDLAERFQIKAVPTLFIYHQGKALAMREGGMNQNNLDRWIQSTLQQAGVQL